MTKAFPVLKSAPLPKDTVLLSERSELGDAQGGPPPAKPFLIPHSKRPRRRVPNRQGGGEEVLDERETDRTNLVLDPPVLIPFEGTLLDKDPRL